MKWHDVVDIWPRATAAGASDWTPPGLYVRVLSDFDEAPVGVAALALPPRDQAPVLEKHLRDAGVTETVSSVLLHGLHRSAELASVFYTAVPIAARLRRARWGERGQHLFVFPVAALLARAVTANPVLGAALLVKDGAALVLVAARGQVRVAEWFALEGRTDDDARRLADIVRRDLLAVADEAGTALAPSEVRIFHADGAAASAEGVVQSTAQALAQRLQGMAAPQALGELRATVAPAVSLLAQARLSDAIQSRLDRLACYAERIVPAAAVAMVALVAAGLLGVISAATELTLQRQGLVEVQQRFGIGDRAEIARLSALEIERMNSRAQLQELLALRDKGARLPDLRRILHDIKLALPDNVRIAEVGIAADDDASVIFVSGAMQWSGHVLSDEHRLVSALQERGYIVKQRDFFSASTSSGFRLALTWGVK